MEAHRGVRALLSLHRLLAGRVPFPLVYCCLLTLLIVLARVGLMAADGLRTGCDEPAWAGMSRFFAPLLVLAVWAALFPLLLVALPVVRLTRKTPASIDELMPWEGRRWLQGAVLLAGTAALGVFHAYLDWPLFAIHDGPYRADVYPQDPLALDLHSAIPLQRAGQERFTLEVRVDPGQPATSVFVLREPDGSVLWKRVPRCAERFGRIALEPRPAPRTWWGGWSVGLEPEFTEPGTLYLGPLGGFRYFYHSW